MHIFLTRSTCSTYNVWAYILMIYMSMLKGTLLLQWIKLRDVFALGIWLFRFFPLVLYLSLHCVSELSEVYRHTGYLGSYIISQPVQSFHGVEDKHRSQNATNQRDNCKNTQCWNVRVTSLFTLFLPNGGCNVRVMHLAREVMLIRWCTKLRLVIRELAE